MPSWTAMYVFNAFIIGWVLVVGFGLGGWASMINLINQIDTFGLFAKCYQCPEPPPPAGAPPPLTHPVVEGGVDLVEPWAPPNLLKII